MKQHISILLVMMLLFLILLPVTAYAEGEGNIDNGGGGLDSGNSENYWNARDEGVRITVVRANNRVTITTSVDFTNKFPSSTTAHFGKVSKLQYNSGRTLTPHMNGYTYNNPGVDMPRIISSGSGGQADPDHPVTVHFTIGGQTYTVSGVYYPDGGSQLVWVRWRTPSIPQTMAIHVLVSGGGSPNDGVITAKIVDLSDNAPPNPVADDRNDSYTTPDVPIKEQRTSASWGVWRPLGGRR